MTHWQRLSCGTNRAELPASLSISVGSPAPNPRCHINGWVCLCGVLLLYVVLTMLPYAWAQSGTPSEYEVKAAFLFNFAKFIEWPAQHLPHAGSPILIGILGEDPFDDVLDRVIKGKSIDGRPVLIKRAKTVEPLRSCHIVFVSRSERKRLSQIAGALAEAGVVTVSDMEQFLEHGGIINFVIENNRVRFDINKRMADRAGLKISSKLLVLAKSVMN
ncbi:MAG: YfiR family protein [Acidobacteriota bacterium]|nr:YfiR family protein [Acidobacteriota bacterium]